MLLWKPMIARISYERCRGLTWRVWWHTLVFVAHEITYHRAFVALFSSLLWKNRCHFAPKSIKPCYIGWLVSSVICLQKVNKLVHKTPFINLSINVTILFASRWHFNYGFHTKAITITFGPDWSMNICAAVVKVLTCQSFTWRLAVMI